MIPFNHKKPDFDKNFYIKQWGKFIKAWKWYNEKGEWIFCTARYENESGKNIIPFHYKNDKWKTGQLLSNNRPLMDIHKILKSEKEILLVEGEKCYDAAKILKDEFDITTWSGATGGIAKTDWKPLKEKIVYYWYDNDDPGRKTIKFLKNKLNKLILVHPPGEKEKGWDIADAINEKWDVNTLFAFIKQYEEIENTKEHKTIENIEWPFKILGPGSNYYFFLHGENGMIFKVKQGSLSNSHLQHLAPLDFWRDYFGYETKRGVSIAWQNAQDILIRECNMKNPFDHNKVRGRGIWQSGKKLVIHTGKKLITYDKEIDIRDYSPNGHIYEKTIELKLNIQNLKINEFEISNIKSCIEKLSITNEIEKLYLIGWCVLAPFGGALNWRPHIWLTGPAGSGKTAIIQMIILKILGDFCLYAEGEGTTGAGIVQNLKNDSFAILHDEVDKSQKTKEELRFELGIARSSSSSQGKMMKGTADQTGKRYTFHSMFCFSSINHLLEKKSDRSRFSLISLMRNEKIDWKNYRKEIQETFNDRNCEKIRSRVFFNWEYFKKNITKFSDICGVYCGDQRLGDQIGTLLAGALTFYELKIFTENEINKICDKYIQEIENDNDLTDELELLLKIFTTKIKYLGYNEKYEDTTLLNLLQRAAGKNIDNTPDKKAILELMKYGIKYDFMKNKVYIAYNYEWLKNILMNTMWHNNYGAILKRLSFAGKRTEVVHFSTYYHGRAVVLKADNVLRLSDDIIYMEAGF
jgi:putative DNA primase/helicase